MAIDLPIIDRLHGACLSECNIIYFIQSKVHPGMRRLRRCLIVRAGVRPGDAAEIAELADDTETVLLVCRPADLAAQALGIGAVS